MVSILCFHQPTRYMLTAVESCKNIQIKETAEVQFPSCFYWLTRLKFEKTLPTTTCVRRAAFWVQNRLVGAICIARSEQDLAHHRDSNAGVNSAKYMNLQQAKGKRKSD